jgi:hypothetical protein
MTNLVAGPPATFAPNRQLAAGTVASLLVHGLLIGSLFLLTPLRQLIVPAPRPVAVEIVTEAQFRTIEAPPVTAPTPQITAPNGSGGAAAPGSGPASPANAPPSTILGVHIATEFYAGSILQQPGMEKIRRTLDGIAPSERLVQLCNIEGLEQIRRAEPGYDPDTLVSYAMSDPLVAGLTLSAPGAAFRSRRRWFGLALKCTVAADLTSVTAFEFKLGKPIPQSEWEAHNLSAEDSDE